MTAAFLHAQADALAERARECRDPKRKRVLEARAYVLRTEAYRVEQAEQRAA